MADYQPTDPLTMGGMDPQSQLAAILQQIQQTNQQPLLPDSPLGQLGTVLQGFASGVQGRQNPGIADNIAMRQSRISGLNSAAGVAGAMSTLQSHELDRKQRQQTNLAQIINQSLDDGLKTGDVDTIAFALQKRNEMLGKPTSMDEARTIAKDKVSRDLLEKRGKEFATYALLGVEIQGMPPEIMKLAQSNPAALRSAYGIANPELEAAKIEKEKVEAEKIQFETGLKMKEQALRMKPVRTPSEQLELDSIRGLRESPDKDNAMQMAREFMRMDPKLPLDMALDKAIRIIKKAEHSADKPDKPEKLSDAGKIAAAIQAKNPGMGEGQALLTAYQQMGAARKINQDAEDTASRTLDIIKNVEFYADKVLSEGLGARAMSAPGKLLSSALGNDPNIEGLKRQLGYLSVIAREMGQRGNLSEPEQQRAAQLLQANIYSDKSIAKEGIAELRKILQAGVVREQRKREGATQIPGPTDPRDPDNIRQFVR